MDSAPVVADVDGDGDADVVVGSRDGALQYLDNAAGHDPSFFVQLRAVLQGYQK